MRVCFRHYQENYISQKVGAFCEPIIRLVHVIFLKLRELQTCKGQSNDEIYFFRGNSSYKGISVESLYSLVSVVQNIKFSSKAVLCNHTDVAPAKWNQKSIFVFPGGTCSEWDDMLSVSQQQQIYQWVLKGGRIFGICAGSYYCSEVSEYNVDGNSITKMRKIALFPGTCRGPVYSPKLKVVKVRWEKSGKEGDVAVIGSGAFFPNNQKVPKSYQVLARFMDESIAVVKCIKGKGAAVLSTPHWEFDCSHLDNLEKLFREIEPEIESMKRRLKESEAFRRDCLSEMLEELNK